MFSRRKQRRTFRDFGPRQRVLMGLGALVQFSLLAAAQIDLLRRPAALVRGSKWAWRAIALVNFIGPVAYFVAGRRAAPSSTLDVASEGAT
jgi:hypothetical protein